MSAKETTLTLPGNFVLLLHKGDGAHHTGPIPSTATAAAEVGELALRQLVVLDGRKLRVLSEGPTGTEWIDTLLAEFTKKSGSEHKPVDLGWWQPLQAGNFGRHRQLLVQAGALGKQTKKKILGLIKNEHYYPDTELRDSLLTTLHDALRGEEAVEDRTALLAAIVHSSGLGKLLDFDDAERERLKAIAEGEDLNGLVQSTVATIAATVTSVMVLSIPAVSG